MEHPEILMSQILQFNKTILFSSSLSGRLFGNCVNEYCWTFQNINGYYRCEKYCLNVKKRETAIKSMKHVLGIIREFLGFRLFFLGKEVSDVEVIEVNEIDFENLKRQLNKEKSVFMTTIQDMN